MKKQLFILSAMTCLSALTFSSCNSYKLPTSVALDEEKEPDFPDYFYLSDLAPKEVISGSEKHNFLAVDAGLEKEGDLNKLSLLTNNITRTATIFNKGISLHAGKEAKVTYDVTNMGVTHLSATFGINANSRSGNGSAVLKIYTDKSADYPYVSPKISQRDTAINIDVALDPTSSTLTIEMIDENNKDASHAILANPKLYANFVALDALDIVGNTVDDYRGVHRSSTPGAMLKLKTAFKGQYNNDNYYAIDRRFAHGFGLHTFDKDENTGDRGISEYSIDISGTNAKRFTAFYGISSDQSTTADPELKFSVYSDVQTNPIYSSNKKLQSIAITNDNNIDVVVPSGTNKLTFKTEGVNDQGKNGGSCHPILVEPRIYTDNGNSPRFFDLNAPNLHQGDFLDYQFTYTDYKGNIHDITDSDDLIISSSDPTKVNVIGNKIYGQGEGEATLTFKYGDSTYTKEIYTFGDNNYFQLASPNGSEIISVGLDDHGFTYYSITHKGETVVRPSLLSFDADEDDYIFIGSVISLAHTKVKTINEDYRMVSGKYSIYHNHYNTADVILTNADGKKLVVELRAYDDGCAFRYSFGDGVTITLDNAEGTKINLNPNDMLYFQQSRNFHKYSGSHEEMYFAEKRPAAFKKWDGVTSDLPTPLHPQKDIQVNQMVMPLAYKTINNTSVAISEAGLDGNYPGSEIIRQPNGSEDDITDNIYKINIPQQQYYTYMEQTPEIKVTNFTSPWRAFVIGSEKTLIESTMIENLSDSQEMNQDFSWVKPGITSWSWMSGVNHHAEGESATDYQGRKDVMMSYIDLAAEMGWQYYILDEGWPNRIAKEEAIAKGYLKSCSDHAPGQFPIPGDGGFRDFMPEVIQYANSKNVGLIAWIHSSQFNDPTNDYQQMRTLISDLHRYGFKGVKADFFDNEAKFTIEVQNRLYEELLKNKMIGNLHGANKPTGERRKYQNIINREGVLGEESNHIYTEQTACQVYCRALTGPTDFTPYIYPASRSDTSMAQQMAYPVAFESGMTCFASMSEEFYGLNNNIKDYYVSYPSNWDNTHYISGSIHEGLTIARESRDNRFYVGGFNTYAKTEEINFDFLNPNYIYEAKIYTDGDDARSVRYQKVDISFGDKITVHMNHNGGFAIKLVAKNANKNSNMQLGFLLNA